MAPGIHGDGPHGADQGAFTAIITNTKVHFRHKMRWGDDPRHLKFGDDTHHMTTAPATGTGRTAQLRIQGGHPGYQAAGLGFGFNLQRFLHFDSAEPSRLDQTVGGYSQGHTDFLRPPAAPSR